MNITSEQIARFNTNPLYRTTGVQALSAGDGRGCFPIEAAGKCVLAISRPTAWWDSVHANGHHHGMGGSFYRRGRNQLLHRQHGDPVSPPGQGTGLHL